MDRAIKKNYISKKELVWLALLVIFFCITRFYRLWNLPGGMHGDEVGMAYDAWCLSQFGVDRWLKTWPVYLTNYGGGQSALYAYIMAFIFKLFGFQKFLIRVPAVLFSLITLIWGMKLVKRLYPGKWMYPYVYGTIVVIAPYFIMASRFALDCNLMLGLSIAFIYTFIGAIESEKKSGYFMAGILGGLVLYTYVLSYIVLPFFLLFSMFYLIYVKKFDISKWGIMAIPMGILAMPLIAVQIVNMFDLREMQWGIFTITKLFDYRVGEVSAPTWEKFLGALSSMFYGDRWAYNSIPGIPVLYGITVVFFVIGICRLIYLFIVKVAKKEYCEYIFVLFWLCAMMIIATLVESNVNKVNAAYGVIVIIALYGIEALMLLFSKRKPIAITVIALCYFVGFLNFSRYYFGGSYEVEYNPLPLFSETVEEAYEDILEDPRLYTKLTQMAQGRLYYAVSARPTPYEFLDGENTGSIMCGTLNIIDEQFNYIVDDHFTKYMNSLREAGFEEKKYEGYSLFYKY